MALYLTLKHLCFAIALISIATSCCKAQVQTQDAIQIVAKAALCLDNRTVINRCISLLGSNSSRNSNNTGFCKGPCYGQAMLMVNCVDGVLSNFAFYSAGMMQGVRSIFQNACPGNDNSTTGGSSGNMMAVPNHGNGLFIHGYVPVWMLVLLTCILLGHP